MLCVQATTGGGGWPLSVFLSPDLKPVYGGTYFPPRGAYGRPGFPQVLQALAVQWETEKVSISIVSSFQFHSPLYIMTNKVLFAIVVNQLHK